MPGYNSKGHGLLTPIMEAFSQNYSPTSQRPSPKEFRTLLRWTSRHPSNQSSFRKGQTTWWDHPPTSSSIPRSEQVKAFGQENNPVSVGISLAIVFKALFASSNYVICTQEWSNLARDNVMHLRRTPPLVSFLVGCAAFSSPWWWRQQVSLKLW
jgi:hypothetical protein